MLNRRLLIGLAVLSLIVLGPRAAAAQQTDPLRLGVGYQLLHVSFDGGAGETFPFGAYIDIDRVLRSDDKIAWGWMGQFEAGFDSAEGINEQIYTAMGGIRLASTRRAKWMPSGHGLIGLGTLNASCADFCAGTDNGVALQGSVAVSTNLDEKKAITIGFKATKLKLRSGGLFNAALAVGVRMTIGQP